MGYIIHDSFLERYRSPLGAVCTGSSVRIALRIQCYEDARAVLTVYSSDGKYAVEMKREGDEFSAVIETPENVGVLWYNFHVEAEGVSGYYSPAQDAVGGLGELCDTDERCYQLTVYERGFKTPDPFKGALMYQIFPDRFASSGKNVEKGRKAHEAKGRSVLVHSSFGEEVCYLPHGGSADYSPDDYFCGDLKGIESKLGYLKELGIEVIYLNPIFEAASNHRYNTADYMTIDPFLGNEQDFASLISHARELGMRVILDGVFSHTGSDSVYFQDALKGGDSPYYSWYSFTHFPDDYKCWWGFKTLPEVNEHDPSWQEFIIDGKDSVMRHWLNKGAAGYRLDVADELPDDVIFKMRAAVKSCSEEKLLLGEVWEDATTKLSYGSMRRYALGSGLDSVMNYPLRAEIIAFLKGKTDARAFLRFLHEQQQNYPKEMYYCLMNMISSHDVERMRTVLSLDCDTSQLSREEQAKVNVSPEEDERGAALTRLAIAIIMSVPGMPSLYYGDECGMHGLKDPFNRRPFKPTDEAMTGYCRAWGGIRKSAALKRGEFGSLCLSDDALALVRFNTSVDAFGGSADGECFITVINRADEEKDVCLDLHSLKSGISLEKALKLREIDYNTAVSAFDSGTYAVADGLIELKLKPVSADCLILRRGE